MYWDWCVHPSSFPSPLFPPLQLQEQWGFRFFSPSHNFSLLVRVEPLLFSAGIFSIQPVFLRRLNFLIARFTYPLPLTPPLFSPQGFTLRKMKALPLSNPQPLDSPSNNSFPLFYRRTCRPVFLFTSFGLLPPFLSPFTPPPLIISNLNWILCLDLFSRFLSKLPVVSHLYFAPLKGFSRIILLPLPIDGYNVSPSQLPSPFLHSPDRKPPMKSSCPVEFFLLVKHKSPPSSTLSPPPPPFPFFSFFLLENLKQYPSSSPKCSFALIRKISFQPSLFPPRPLPNIFSPVWKY